MTNVGGKKIRITVLVENTVSQEGLGCEHGLSFFIETGGDNIVFDTGQTDLFAANAEKLGCDLSMVGHVVLSHGHYDHTGGLNAVFQQSPGAKLWGHSGILVDRYSIKDPSAPKYVGPPEGPVETLETRGWESTDHGCEIESGIHATGYVSRETDFEDTGGPFYLDQQMQVEDPIVDDQSLWFRSAEGLVILLGCAHAGIVNIIEQCMQVSGVNRLHAIVGGLHLVNADNHRMTKTIEALRKYSPDLVGACHCTGDHAIVELKQVFGDKFVRCGSGTELEFTLEDC